MARVVEPTPEQVEGYRAWVASRPPAVRAVAERFEPWSLYRLRSTGHRVTVQAFTEQEGGGVTLRVHVSGTFNRIAFARDVFGIAPDDLEPCELPAADEVLGAAWQPHEVEAHLPDIRAAFDRDRSARDDDRDRDA